MRSAGEPTPVVRFGTAINVVDREPRPPLLEARTISKVFDTPHGSMQALTDVSITVAHHEFVAIVGPSGCGKSTFLEILAGLQKPTSGTVLIDEVETRGNSKAVGYMPQNDLLLPWRSVLDNTILGLEIAGTPRKQARREAMSWFPRFGLRGFEGHYPAALSGGMRQRAALLRTFLTGRPILLLDEPFGALDALTRAQMQTWLLGVQDEFQKTVLLVTHDVEEALYLSDRVYLMSARPASISGMLVVPLDRPRQYEQTVTSPEFMRLKRTLLAGLVPQPGFASS